ncbi:MAG: iron ABC transporter permease, partial [Gramella sp.]|nr:iron ABC transporter permease [Christiangramia sp.]
MLNQKKYTFSIILLFLAVIITGLFNISLGSVSIPISEVTSSLLGLEVEKDTWRYIILNYRLPKAITAIITGSGLAVSGLMMQTLFRNPLAGPYVLGLS